MTPSTFKVKQTMKCCEPLTIITKRPILDVAAVVDPPLVETIFLIQGNVMSNFTQNKGPFHT